MSRGPDAIVHSFGERLAWSGDLSDEPAWIDFYRTLWPNLIAATRIDADSWHQRRGVDRVVILKNGRQFQIDEKKREKDYGDFLCEVVSVCDGVRNGEVLNPRGVGWTLDPHKVCDFVAYAVLPSRRCWLLSFEILRLAAVANLERWQARPGAWPKLAENRGYKTANVAVPWDDLFACMRAVQDRAFASDLVLPAPEVTANQVRFGWDAK